jgi:hypothetical protein
VKSVDADFAAGLRWHFEPFWRPQGASRAVPIHAYVREEDADSPEPPLSYFRDWRHVFSDERTKRVVEFAIYDMLAYVPLNGRDFVYLHAGVVGTEDGAVLLPGAQNAGKSSLVAALLREGFDYLSDELGPIDPITSRVYPFPKRISVDPESMELLPGVEDLLQDRDGPGRDAWQRFLRPDDLGAKVAGPSTVRSLIFVSTDHQGPPRLAPMSTAEAVEKMAENAFNLYRYRDRGVILLARVAKEAEAYSLEGGSPGQRALLLANRLL